MRKAYLPRHCARAAAYERRRRRRMVRRTERPFANYSVFALHCARNGVYFGYFKGFFKSKFRKYRRDAPRKHCFAGARRAHKQQIMPARNGYFRRTLGTLLPAYVHKILRVCYVFRVPMLRGICVGLFTSHYRVHNALQIVRRGYLNPFNV